jgi:hypothetical protein
MQHPCMTENHTGKHNFVAYRFYDSGPSTGKSLNIRDNRINYTRNKRPHLAIAANLQGQQRKKWNQHEF